MQDMAISMPPHPSNCTIDASTENNITVIGNFAKFLLANDVCNCIQTLR